MRRRRSVLYGEVVGRRGWGFDQLDIASGSPSLGSTWAARAWVPGVNEARCIRHDKHHAPVHNCHCGLYAVYDPQTVSRFLSGRLEIGRAIVGLVTGWGNVEVHMDGFRSEYARVAALVDDKRLPIGLAQKLADRYGVPLIGWDEWLDDDFIREFGDPVPVGMRPSKPGQGRWVSWVWKTRREKVADSFTWLVLAGGLLTVYCQSFWPVLGTVWAIVLITVSSLVWPEWWDR